ncbi:MAG: isoprenylcysteine carboxylmethyltransferase family protein [Candidatus Omnitrophica bacterium]|nr:isoprenylcysteine carboxylmethyltransferase family protein [Candidatus Omnitrophota bacterium]
MKKRLKINGVLIFISAALIILFPHIFLRRYSAVLADQAVRISGVLLVIIGQLLRVSARGYKAENSGNGKLLIQGGPYALVRNPMYLGILLIGIGMGGALFKYWVVFAFIIIFIFRYLMLIFSEEKKLLGVFGNAYLEYSSKVPRLLPPLRKLFTGDILGSVPLKPEWLYKEIGSIVAVLSAIVFLWCWGLIRG